MQDKAIENLKESLLKDIPMKPNGITVDVNANRIQQDKNMRSLISVTLDTHVKMKDHVKSNDKSFKVIQNVGIGISAVFGVAIIGIVANWTLASILAVFGSVAKGLSMVFGRS